VGEVRALCGEPSARPDPWWHEYRPQGVDPAVWPVVRPFLLECGDKLDLPKSSGGVHAVRVLTRLAEWCVREGIPLDVELVLDPATVERFASVALAGQRSRATDRSALRRVGPRLTERAPWEARPETIPRNGAAPPYSRSELAALWAAAKNQPTRGRQRAARAIVALGAGAGLDGRWVARVTAADVIADVHGVGVQVGEPQPRLVPVLVEWHDEVRGLADATGTGCLVGPSSTSRNRASALVSWLIVGHGQPKFSMSRLRSTWLVRHLELGTRLPELTHAAGLADTRVLSDLLDHVPPMPTVDALRALQGRR